MTQQLERPAPTQLVAPYEHGPHPVIDGEVDQQANGVPTLTPDELAQMYEAPSAPVAIEADDTVAINANKYANYKQVRLADPHFTTSRQRAEQSTQTTEEESTGRHSDTSEPASHRADESYVGRHRAQDEADPDTYGRHASSDTTPNEVTNYEGRHRKPSIARRVGRGALRVSGLKWAGNYAKQMVAEARENAADIRTGSANYTAQKPERLRAKAAKIDKKLADYRMSREEGLAIRDRIDAIRAQADKTRENQE